MSGMREKNTLNQHCDETIHQTISSTNKVFAFSFSEPQWVTFREWGSRDDEQSERRRRQPESCCCWERERDNSEVPPPGVLSAPATADRPIYETGGKCERRVRRRGGWTNEKDWRGVCRGYGGGGGGSTSCFVSGLYQPVGFPRGCNRRGLGFYRTRQLWGRHVRLVTARLSGPSASRPRGCTSTVEIINTAGWNWFSVIEREGEGEKNAAKRLDGTALK